MHHPLPHNPFSHVVSQGRSRLQTLHFGGNRQDPLEGQGVVTRHDAPMHSSTSSSASSSSFKAPPSVDWHNLIPHFSPEAPAFAADVECLQGGRALLLVSVRLIPDAPDHFTDYQRYNTLIGVAPQVSQSSSSSNSSRHRPQQVPLIPAFNPLTGRWVVGRCSQVA